MNLLKNIVISKILKDIKDYNIFNKVINIFLYKIKITY